MAPSHLVERLWFERSVPARLSRLALAPAAAAYALVAASRRGLYDRRALRTYEPVIPAISVGNLTVGGTGKTPVAAWIARSLRDRGRRSGIALRGYAGGDETAVHRILNPDVPVAADPDRLAGIRVLAAAACDVAILDDAFQHRRVRRALDVVLVSADAWPDVRWPLPSGPWRESLHALRRADLILITRKAAPSAAVDAAHDAVQRAAPGVGNAVVALYLDELRTVDGRTQPLSTLRGSRVCAVAAIGWPAAFAAQLEAAGARVDPVFYRDHHDYTSADVAAIIRRAPVGTTVVCTLKDAVKLAGQWPREAPPIWYVSQRLEVERGGEAVQAALDAVSRLKPTSAT